MKFEIKPINIKERTITVTAEVNEYSDDFKEQVKDFMEDTPTFKESEAIKLFNHLYENSPVDLVGFNHLGEYGERQNTTFSFETDEIITETLTPIVAQGIGKNYNNEVLKQLNTRLKIATIDPTEYNVILDKEQKYDVFVSLYNVILDKEQKYDVFVSFKSTGYAHKVYKVFHRTSLEWTNGMLALLCDYNLCFGFRTGSSIDLGAEYRCTEITIQTD